MALNLMAWAAIGLVIGFIGSKMINLKGDDPQVDLIVGVIGAVIGGVTCNVIRGIGVGGFTIWSFVVALAAAAVAMAAWHAMRRLASRA